MKQRSHDVLVSTRMYINLVISRTTFPNTGFIDTILPAHLVNNLAATLTVFPRTDYISEIQSFIRLDTDTKIYAIPKNAYPFDTLDR